MRWNGKRIVRWCHKNPNIAKALTKNCHWRILIYDNGVRALLLRFSKTRNLSFFFVYIFIHISANMSPFGLKFSQMILHTETSKLMYNWSFLFIVLHKPTLLPSTFKKTRKAIVASWSGTWQLRAICVTVTGCTCNHPVSVMQTP